MEKTKVLSRRIHIPQTRDNVNNNVASRNSEGLRRIRSTHASLVQPEWTGTRQQHPPLNVSANMNGIGMWITSSFLSKKIFNNSWQIFNTRGNLQYIAQSNFKRRSSSPMYDLQSRERNQWNGQVQINLRSKLTKLK